MIQYQQMAVQQLAGPVASAYGLSKGTWLAAQTMGAVMRTQMQLQPFLAEASSAKDQISADHRPLVCTLHICQLVHHSWSSQYQVLKLHANWSSVGMQSDYIYSMMDYIYRIMIRCLSMTPVD